MMKKKLITLTVLVVAAGACNNATFGSRSPRKAASEVDPNVGATSPANAPLDVSSQDANKGKDGPQGGKGQVDAKTIELTCDQSQGAEIVVAGPGIPTGAEPSGTSGNANGTAGKGAESGFVKAALFLGDANAPYGGKGVPLDKNGNPIGKDGGKDGGKDSVPLPVQSPVPVPDTARVTTTIKGRFCPASQSHLTVLFVVDYSGSMGLHVDNIGGPQQPGNDPQISGSCGRLRAAQAILTRLQASAQPTDQIQIGMVPFAGGIVTSKVVQLTSLAAFAQLASKDTFCQYVVQDTSGGLDPQNPGGIDGSALGIDASTNYVAAFTAAQSMLSGVYGQKDLFFISDGEPTSPGGDGSTATPQVVAASVAAGQALRGGVDNMTFNALLLQNAELGTHAQDILGQVAGSPNQVVLAANADQLATQIAQFHSTAITLSNGQATLAVDPYPRADVGLQYLNLDAAATDGSWVYLSQPFVLLGKPGQDVLNLVEVTARGSDGSTFSSVVKIHYRQ